MNAHNGIGSYDLMGGIFRMVCSNGMVISEEDFGRIHIRHIGFEAEQVKEASRKLVGSASRIADKITTWQNLDLTPRRRDNFFKEAACIRFSNPSQDIVKEVSRPRRLEDDKTDLWRTFNVAQENLLRGGFVNGETRRKVRAISHIGKDVEYNTKLWDLADNYANALGAY
jgi:hypothetical protein